MKRLPIDAEYDPKSEEDPVVIAFLGIFYLICVLRGSSTCFNRAEQALEAALTPVVRNFNCCGSHLSVSTG